SVTNARTILLTDVVRFIGSHLADGLVAQGMRVRGFDNFATGSRTYLNPAVELHEGDVRDPASLRPAFADVDCVFHTAALPRVMLAIERPVETHMTNVIGTINVLIAARAAGVRRVIYSGSSSVYGDQAPLPLRESD